MRTRPLPHRNVTANPVQTTACTSPHMHRHLHADLHQKAVDGVGELAEVPMIPQTLGHAPQPAAALT